MIVAADIGEVGIAAAQGEDDGVRAIGLDVRDRRQQGLGSRFGVRPHVISVGGDHVIGREALAVVESSALQKLEDPGLGAVRGLHALDQVGRDVSFRVDLGEAVGHGTPERHLRARVGVAGRIGM